ncbi:hypothetical protein [Ketogulonicigenium vulgare]|uniref:hypothetical protein n=1 Tax=Ketogulonicigenium vulgare TaxID=92945 RepID=UPI002358F7E2|nr:hypothetical protein [Ketogulonicigenium vulgare]
MFGMRSLMLVSLLALAACSGGDSGAESHRRDFGFNSNQSANLNRATVAPTTQGSVATTSNGASYNPASGTMVTGSGQGAGPNEYSGTYIEGQWGTDRNGNRLLVTNPGNTQFVRQIEVVGTNILGVSQWHRGVIGFVTPEMPRSGNFTYRGVTNGVALGSGPIDFSGRA